MSTPAATHGSHRAPPSPSRAFARFSFAIMVAGWLAFAVALIASPHTLDDLWTTVRDLPLLAEGLVWLIAFPFLVGLAIWQAAWAEPARLAAIGVLAIAYTLMFVPRERS